MAVKQQQLRMWGKIITYQEQRTDKKTGPPQYRERTKMGRGKTSPAQIAK